jgi:two-component system sensor histidine kinase KdpD
MSPSLPTTLTAGRAVRAWLAIAIWAAGWAAMLWLDGTVDLANLAMLLVLSSALASLWLPAWLSALAGALAVLAFNWVFVPPRGTFSVDLHQHALLLGTMLAVSTIVAAVMAALRRQVARSEGHAARAEQLRTWGDTLRDAADPLLQAGALQTALAGISGVPVALLIASRPTVATQVEHPAAQEEDALQVGGTDADQQAGLWHCLRQGQPMGPGTGRHEELADWYLPLRGRGVTLGAAVLRGIGAPSRQAPELRLHAQALCDQLGLALQRALALRAERQARDAAQEQGVRNALLAAISHDYRTPLATIMSAASALDEQADRHSLEQRRRLARSIADEAAQLSRLADNTLQLARLDAPGLNLRCDWESAEEIVGAALRRARASDPTHRVRARLEPGLPLLWCDAMLVQQALDNLIDNALKYSPPESAIEVLIHRRGDQVVLAVRDRGPGVAPAWRERIFEPFHRGAAPMEGATQDAGSSIGARRGAGVGLAVCRAIAGAHGGALHLRPRAHGGCSFEFSLPLRDAPEAPPETPASP